MRTFSSSTNPAYVPGLAPAALEVLARGGVIAEVDLGKEELRMTFHLTPESPPVCLSLDKSTHPHGACLVAQMYGEKTPLVKTLPPPMVEAFKMPILNEAVRVAIAGQAVVTAYGFDTEELNREQELAILEIKTAKGTRHQVAVRPGARQASIEALQQVLKT